MSTTGLLEICRVLDEAPGIKVVGTICDDDEWSVIYSLDIDDNRPTTEAWLSAEFIAWVVGSDLARSGRSIQITASSVPPYLNTPSQTLKFTMTADWHGDAGVDPNWLAAWLDSLAETNYIHAGQLDEFHAQADDSIGTE